MKIKVLDREGKLVSTLKIPNEEIDHYLDTHFKGTIFDTVSARAIVKAFELEARPIGGKEKKGQTTRIKAVQAPSTPQTPPFY